LTVQLSNINQRTTYAKIRYQEPSSEDTAEESDIVESRYQVKTSGNRLRRLECGVICSVEISNSVIIICSWDL
jgi:hypothetical protein